MLCQRKERPDAQACAVPDVEFAGRLLGHPGRDPELVAVVPLHDEDLGRTLKPPQHANGPTPARMEPVVDLDLRIIGVLRPPSRRPSAGSSRTSGCGGGGSVA